MMMKLKWPSDQTLKRINWLLLTVILVSNGYVLLAPLWPQATFAVQTHITKPVKVDPSSNDSLAKLDRSSNHLVIPSLQLNDKIFDGTSPYTVNLGIWRRPLTSTPDKGSNTVLVGHRFTYDGPSIFYHLDKVKVGEQVVVVWDHKLYVYKVADKRDVEPTDVGVEGATNDKRLTIYTCDPMWSTRYRLVITAILERQLP